MADHADIDHTGLTGVGVGDATAHIADATDAHDASAVSFDATGLAHTSATDVQEAVEDLDAAISSAGALGAWTNYTPTITGSGSNPTLGSSTLIGRYKSLDSKTYIIYIEINIVTGGSWNAGSGNWIFSLPAGLTTVASKRQSIIAHVSTSTRRWPGSGIIGGGATTIAGIGVSDASGNFTVGATSPVTWATGEYVVIGPGIIEVQ